jgi:multiple sugar transport system ATP-binding protein
MNFLSFRAALPAGADTVEIEGARIAMPALRQDVSERDLVLGARPEHVRFADSSPLRGEVFGVEYLGTTQIVTLNTSSGRVKARLPSDLPARIGESVGLTLRPEKLSLFDKATGKVLRSALHDAAAQTRSAAMEARHG